MSDQKIQRYDITASTTASGQFLATITPSTTGQWTQHADVEPRLLAADALAKAFTEALDMLAVMEEHGRLTGNEAGKRSYLGEELAAYRKAVSK